MVSFFTHAKPREALRTSVHKQQMIGFALQAALNYAGIEKETAQVIWNGEIDITRARIHCQRPGHYIHECCTNTSQAKAKQKAGE